MTWFEFVISSFLSPEGRAIMAILSSQDPAQAAKSLLDFTLSKGKTPHVWLAYVREGTYFLHDTPRIMLTIFFDDLFHKYYY